MWFSWCWRQITYSFGNLVEYFRNGGHCDPILEFALNAFQCFRAARLHHTHRRKQNERKTHLFLVLWRLFFHCDMITFIWCRWLWCCCFCWYWWRWWGTLQWRCCINLSNIHSWRLQLRHKKTDEVVECVLYVFVNIWGETWTLF